MIRATLNLVQRDVVLVGGGHLHIEVLRRFAMSPLPGVRLTVIAREISVPYSGMVPGYFAGHYRHEECHIDLRHLCWAAGARLYHTSAVGINPEKAKVACQNRPDVDYDFLSIDIGSVPNRGEIKGAFEYAIAIKPTEDFIISISEIEAECRIRTSLLRVGVVGAGAGGVELILALCHRFKALARSAEGTFCPVQFCLVGGDINILPALACGTRKLLRRALQAHEIDLYLGQRIGEITPRTMVLANGAEIDCDHCILVTGASAPPWLGVGGVAVNELGFVKVDQMLRSISHPEIFVGGDAAAFSNALLPKSGVYAVRQGPVLAENLRRALLGRKMKTYRPQKYTLALISTGEKSAVASLGRFAFSGSYLWRLKDIIDRRFMDKYRGLAGVGHMVEVLGNNPLEPMRCAGCGAKIAQDVLQTALLRLSENPDLRLALGHDIGDDAAISPGIPAECIGVQTVDHFKSFVNDPYLFGRITANHCLGDIYAMGATASSALATVVMAHNHSKRQEADLAELLTGACEVLAAAGARLIGGHSAEGDGLSFGLSVTGYGVEADLLRRGGLCAGDALILTKPLGTGVLLNADMRGLARGEWITGAIDNMQISARMAASICKRYGARAACDVTGFGLAGHLREMLQASGVDAKIHIRDIPVLPGFLELADEGIESTIAPSNRKAMIGIIHDRNPSDHAILYDPQTAGGLLVSVPKKMAVQCVRELRAEGYDGAAIIGELCVRASSRPSIDIID